MGLKFGLGETILNSLEIVFNQYPQIKKVLIFGSRVRGDFRDGSDIDLAVIAPEMADNEFSELWNAIDALPILFKIDLIHWDQLQNEALKQKILKEGKVFYP